MRASFSPAAVFVSCGEHQANRGAFDALVCSFASAVRNPFVSADRLPPPLSPSEKWVLPKIADATFCPLLFLRNGLLDVSFWRGTKLENHGSRWRPIG